MLNNVNIIIEFLEDIEKLSTEYDTLLLKPRAETGNTTADWYKTVDNRLQWFAEKYHIPVKDAVLFASQASAKTLAKCLRTHNNMN